MDKSTNRSFAVVKGEFSKSGDEPAKQFAQYEFDLLVTAEDDGMEKAASENGDFAREMRLKDELNMIAFNVTSSVHLAKRGVGDMVNRKQGRVLFTSSIAGAMPAPLPAVYGASKAFLRSFSEAIRNEWKDTGVTVMALMPGPTETNFHRERMEDTKVGADEKDSAEDVARDVFEALIEGGFGVRILPETVKAGRHRKLADSDRLQKVSGNAKAGSLMKTKPRERAA